MKRFAILSIIAVFASASMWAATPVAKHLIYIGLDGWGSYSVSAAEMPVVKSLMNKGCYTLQKRANLPSDSAINWATMFMGASSEIHGYTEYNSQTPEIPSLRVYKNGIFPTMFQVYRDYAPDAEIGVLSEWDGIKHVVDSLSCNYVYSGIDLEKYPNMLCELAEDYIIKKKPNLAAIIFDQPDHVGHGPGHNTPEYYAELTRLDGFIGRIIAAAEKAGIIDDTVFMITADHGGINRGHGDKSLMELETPLIIVGKGIKSGLEIKEAVAQYDVAAIVAQILGFTPPQVWRGKAHPEILETPESH